MVVVGPQEGTFTKQKGISPRLECEKMGDVRGHGKVGLKGHVGVLQVWGTRSLLEGGGGCV